MRALAAWRVGAAALFGPLTVLAAVFGTVWGLVAVAALALGREPWGWTTTGIALGVAAAVSPWFVKRGWIDR